MNNSRFKKFLTDHRKRIDGVLDDQLSLISKKSPRELTKALRYAVLGGGKRLRALLVYAVGRSYGANIKFLDNPAAAIEITHAFSLVHDDLPAMDDDSLRRGKATCHLAFDEATAILVGDSLVVGAFELIGKSICLTAEQKLNMINVLAEASGASGMSGGQYLDLHASKKITKLFLEKVYFLKTGALISAAISLGAIAAGVKNKKELGLLQDFGLSMGLAFQIKDDVLDVEGDVKIIGADKIQNKVTYPALVGLKKAKQKIIRLRKKIDDILSKINGGNHLLKEFVDYIFEIEF